MYNPSGVTDIFEHFDSKLIKEAFVRDDLVFEDFSPLIKEESGITDYGNGERIFFENVISIVQKKMSDELFDFRQFALEMNVSKSALHPKNNQFTGLTPSKLVLSFRIQIAQKLLLNYSLNISEVAYQIGFNDAQYFSRCFRNEVGISPKEYRKSMK